MSVTATETVARSGSPGQPDISYTPDYQKYLDRTKRRKQNEQLEKFLPPGFPEKLESDLVWDGDKILGEYDWAYELSSADIEEIDRALQHFKSLNQPQGYINQTTFPLPNLHPQLRSISREIHLGHGFKVLRGIPVSNYTRSENITIYAGLSSHIAPIRGRQDHLFNGSPADVVLAHIKDLSHSVGAESIGSPAYTTEKQVFHTDAGDVIALFCLGEAAQGGQSFLSSSWRVYNELAASRPDLVRTLAEPWPVEIFNSPSTPYALRPLLHHQPAKPTTPERLIIQYARRTLTGYWGLPRAANIPPISEAQAEALDALHFVAEKHAAALDFRQGDIQYVNNLSIFHARGGFRDEGERQRHLVRLWLRDPEYAWETPSALQGRWDGVYAGVTPEKTVFPLEPAIRSASKGTVSGAK